MRKNIKNALVGIMILSSTQSLADNSISYTSDLSKEWTICMGKALKGEGPKDVCSAVQTVSLLPTFWPSFTALMTAGSIGEISKSLSGRERRTIEIASIQANDLIANYDKNTDNFNVEGRQLTETFGKAKQILISKLNKLDSSVNSANSTMLNHDAAMLIVSLAETEQ